MGHRLHTAAVIVAAIATTLVAVSPTAAQGRSVTVVDDRPTAVVTMGDSFISGEAGRWHGNSSNEFADRDGTDRAAYRGLLGLWFYDEARVYGPTGSSGCHRSDVSPVASSGIEVDALINLACSGATTSNLLRAQSGGVGRSGEDPQGDRLAAVAASHRVEMIVVSVGGNDLGYSDIIVDCAVGYVFSSSSSPNTCHQDQQVAYDDKVEDTMTKVGQVLDDIKAVMADAGYHPGAYRLVLQSYPSPIPDGDRFRYSESGFDRLFKGGCPFWNVDADWARQSLAPQLSSDLAAVASSRRAEFLDMQDALKGREACADTADQGDGEDAEWARFVTLGIGQGEIQESLHPNALGQQANGTCLGLLYGSAPGHYRCDNVPGAGPDQMKVTSSMTIAITNANPNVGLTLKMPVDPPAPVSR